MTLKSGFQLTEILCDFRPQVQSTPLRNKVLKRNTEAPPEGGGGRRGSLTLLMEAADINKNNVNKKPPRRKTAPAKFQINDNERRGSLHELLQGLNENKETINSVISKLYRKAEFET